MNPLTQNAVAFASRKRIPYENLVIAAVCGIGLGVLCALFV